MFASLFGKNFDEDIKKWRFLSMLALNMAILIEVSALYSP